MAKVSAHIQIHAENIIKDNKVERTKRKVYIKAKKALKKQDENKLIECL